MLYSPQALPNTLAHSTWIVLTLQKLGAQSVLLTKYPNKVISSRTFIEFSRRVNCPLLKMATNYSMRRVNGHTRDFYSLKPIF
jgi:hypothetical protein